MVIAPKVPQQRAQFAASLLRHIRRTGQTQTQTDTDTDIDTDTDKDTQTQTQTRAGGRTGGRADTQAGRQAGKPVSNSQWLKDTPMKTQIDRYRGRGRYGGRD